MMPEGKRLVGLHFIEALIIVKETQFCGSKALGHWRDRVHFAFKGLVWKLKFCTVSWCLGTLWEKSPQSKGDPIKMCSRKMCGTNKIRPNLQLMLQEEAKIKNVF